MKKFLSSVFALSLVGCFAGGPSETRKSDEYARSGFAGFGKSQTFGTSGTFLGKSNSAVDITSTGGDDGPLLLPYGSMLVINCEEDGTGYFLQDSGATTADSGYISDASSTGPKTAGFGGAFNLEANVPRFINVPNPQNRDSPITVVSQRSNSCAHATAATNLKVAGFPCDAVADCFYAFSTCSAGNGKPTGMLLKIDLGTEGECDVDWEY